MPDLFTLNQEYSFCLSKARVICVKMTSSIDRLPTHCACTLRQHSGYIEQHTQRFFFSSSCILQCALGSFSLHLLGLHKSSALWMKKLIHKTRFYEHPSNLSSCVGNKTRSPHTHPIPWHDNSVEPCCSNHLLFGKWLKSTQTSYATCGRASRDGTHVCLEGRRREGAVEQISQLTSSSAHPRPACPYYYPAGAQSGPLLRG